MDCCCRAIESYSEPEPPAAADTFLSTNASSSGTNATGIRAPKLKSFWAKYAVCLVVIVKAALATKLGLCFLSAKDNSTCLLFHCIAVAALQCDLMQKLARVVLFWHLIALCYKSFCILVLKIACTLVQLSRTPSQTPPQQQLQPQLPRPLLPP